MDYDISYCVDGFVHWRSYPVHRWSGEDWKDAGKAVVDCKEKGAQYITIRVIRRRKDAPKTDASGSEDIFGSDKEQENLGSEQSAE